MKKMNFAWFLAITPLIPLTVAAKCTTTKPAEPVKPEPNNAEENLKAYEFEFHADTDSYSIKKYNIEGSEDKDILLPSLYKNKKVTSIDEEAFTGIKLASGKKLFISETLEKLEADFLTGLLNFEDINPTNVVINPKNKYFTFDEKGNLIDKVNKKIIIVKDISTFPTDIEVIGKNAFSNSTITELILPASVKKIEEGAFYGCSNLEKVTLNEGLETIGKNAFSETGIKEIIVPKSVKTLEAGAFANSMFLTTVTLQEGLETIGEYVFTRTAIKSIVLPNTVKKIAKEAFVYCGELTSVTLNEGLETIEDEAFSDCLSLTEIILPSSIKTLGQKLFSNSYSQLSDVQLTIKIKGHTDPTSKAGFNANWDLFEGSVDGKTHYSEIGKVLYI